MSPRPPGFVGPPEYLDTLGTEENACLLRAARVRLEQLQDELKHLEDLPATYAYGPVQATRQERDCLARAVTKLWMRHARPP